MGQRRVTVRMGPTRPLEKTATIKVPVPSVHSLHRMHVYQLKPTLLTPSFFCSSLLMGWRHVGQTAGLPTRWHVLRWSRMPCRSNVWPHV